MSITVLDLREAALRPVDEVGGKARSLGVLLEAGIEVPDGVVVCVDAFDEHLAEGGLREAIAMELARVDLAELRTEEYWDVSRRLRSLVAGRPTDDRLRTIVGDAISGITGALVVRSSAPHEDGDEHSYAGLHDTVVGVEGLDDVVRAVLSVWGSVYSERSLAALGAAGVDPSGLSMAVVIQPLAAGERSGVTFTRGPVDPDAGTIEAVWGLGEGLVSGLVEPDRWMMRRDGDGVEAHAGAERHVRFAYAAGGAQLLPLDTELRDRAPLEDEEVERVWAACLAAEDLFGRAQDCEWTWVDRPVLTQARPVTVRRLPESADPTPLPLARLAELAGYIDDELLPAMWSEASALSVVGLERLADHKLVGEARRRAEAVLHWREVYRSTLIPFAGGARAFGALWAEVMPGADPFGFVELLVRTGDDYALHEQLLAEVGLPAAPRPVSRVDRDAEERRFLEAARQAGRADAAEALAIGRASWRVRDDDNLYLLRIEREAGRALREIERRLEADAGEAASIAGPSARERLQAAAAMLRDTENDSLDSNRPAAPAADPGVRARQMLGHPAGPGVGSGPARVVLRAEEMADLVSGEVLVVDALEPETAALAVGAAGIVERRGGMLVHGAIVAREHGIPCVTGIADATSRIRPGETVTVDGFLGIVILEDV